MNHFEGNGLLLNVASFVHCDSVTGRAVIENNLHCRYRIWYLGQCSFVHA